MIYEDKKWKYEIAFDNSVYKEVKRYGFNLDEESKKILDKEIDFYRHNYSIMQVMEAYDKVPESEKNNFKTVVLKRIDGILFCPKPLKQYFVDKINNEYAVDKEFFTHLLIVATTKKCTNVAISLYKTILGKYYNPVKREILKYAKRPYTDVVKPRSFDPKASIERLQYSIENDSILQGIWGEKDDTSVVVNYDKGAGFGRIRSHHFTGTSADFTTIHTLGDNVEYQYYRNIYPGKAHFYNTIFINHNRNFDMGSRWVVNGWAMFSSLHARKSIYTKNSKSLSANIMKPLLTIKNYNTAVEQCYLYMLTKMSRQQAFNNLLYLTQKIGMVESYILGGIATELVINQGFATSPMDLLVKYRKVNLGDFFALYRKSK